MLICHGWYDYEKHDVYVDRRYDYDDMYVTKQAQEAISSVPTALS